MKIADSVLTVLDNSQIVGCRMHIPAQLERSLYAKVKKVIEACGGAWNRKEGAHIFPSDPTALIETVIRTGTVHTSAEEGWFPTPAALAKRVVLAAGVKPGDRVLEPSAGTGALVKALVDNVYGTSLHFVENNVGRAAACGELARPYVETGHLKFVEGRAVDFLWMAKEWSLLRDVGIFDKIIMNPPFAKSQDAEHVLAPGGKLVAIMGAGVEFRDSRPYQGVRALIALHGGSMTKLPDDAFKSSGTNVRTMLVEIPRS